MTTLAADQAIQRFKDNENRFDEFVNSDTSYVASDGVVVESLKSFTKKLKSLGQELQTATAGQTVFNITKFTYTTGVGAIRVYRNGERLFSFQETGTAQVTLNDGANDGDEFLFEAFQTVPLGTTPASQVNYTRNSVYYAVQDVIDELINNNAVNAKGFGFGAKGDGISDDTSAIQNALNAGTRVYLPAGVYKITATLTDNGNTKVLFGDGHDRNASKGTIIKLGADIVGIHFSGWCSVLEDLTVQGTMAAYTDYDTASHAVHWQAPRGEIHRVAMVNAKGHGLLYHADNCCKFDTLSLFNNAGHGIYMDKSGDASPNNNASTFINIDSQNNGLSGISDAGLDTFANNFYNCTLQGNQQYGLDCNAKNFHFYGLYCEANAVNDIRWGTNAYYNQVWGYYQNRASLAASIVDNSTGTNFVDHLVTVQQATLQNSWANYGGAQQTAGFYKDRNQNVEVRGMIKGGTTAANTLLFTLPSGYRPTASQRFAVDNNGTYACVFVQSDGGVYLGTTVNNVQLNLDGIRFNAAF